MANGTIWMDSPKAWEGRIEWSSSTDTARNCSYVYAQVYTWKTDGYATSGGGDFKGTLKVGTQTVSFSFQQCDPEEKAYDVCIAELSATINHNSDGTGSCVISCSITKGHSTSLANVTCSGQKTVELDLIPRSSKLTTTGGTLGSESKLVIESDSNSLQYTIKYTCGSASGTIVQKTSSKEVTWTPPVDLAAQSPSSTTVSIKFTLDSYSGSSLIGSSTTTVNYDIPQDVVPSVSAEISDAKGYADVYGGYVQNRSALSVVLTESGSYGSSIVSRQIEFDGKTYTSARATTEIIKSAGDLQLSASVKDSRGRIGSVRISVSVLPYDPPRIDNATVSRCNADGSANKSGGYLIVKFDATITDLEKQNSAAYQIKFKKSADSVYTSVSLDDLTGAFSVSGATVIFEADPSSSYNVVIMATDDFGTSQKSVNGSSKSTFFSRLFRGLGGAFGKVAERVGYLDMGWSIHMNENRLHGLPEPQEADDAATKKYVDDEITVVKQSIGHPISIEEIMDAVYPIGSIYISVNGTNPGNLWGGKWTQLKDRFLLGAGSAYSAGSTGGESAVTLSLSQIPSHYHKGVRRYQPGDYPGSASTGASSGSDDSETHTDYAGGGEAHNNMPPYLAVYMWKRTE